ncbi:hypothetical protein DFH08DRAFT_322844 [Mycena albidolilacea]|uniref:Uncharacterized protein n=1 Tax=Mycena albidolilacea TaxID=1033008 RepID=A0AAD7ALR6_9AGAR|nr:hypothetical protein DFH08DRAFT_322844 [Mycena albidolilacea]
MRISFDLIVPRHTHPVIPRRERRTPRTRLQLRRHLPAAASVLQFVSCSLLSGSSPPRRALLCRDLGLYVPLYLPFLLTVANSLTNMSAALAHGAVLDRMLTAAIVLMRPYLALAGARLASALYIRWCCTAVGPRTVREEVGEGTHGALLLSSPYTRSI